MNYEELKQEVIDRGYDYVKPARIGSFIGRAYQGLCARYSWPFLEETKEGTAPLEISDLRKILTVTDSTQETTLRGMDRRWLARVYPSLTEEGTPLYWYLDNKTVRIVPASATETIVVRYLKIPTELTGAAEPLVPAEWQYLLVDRAIVDCLKDDDEYEEARALRADVEQGIHEMAVALLSRNLQNPMVITRTGTTWDYLG